LTGDFSNAPSGDFSNALDTQGDIDLEPGTLQYKYTLGNPYIGGEFLIKKALSFGLGLRVPLNIADKSNRSVALASDPVDRVEAFMADMIPVKSLISYEMKRGPGLVIQLRGGPAFWLFAGTPSNTRLEIVFNYHAQMGYEFGPWTITSGLSGLWLLTDQVVDGVVVTESHLQQFGMTAGVRLGRLNSALQLRLPLTKNLRSLQDFVIGLHIGILLSDSRGTGPS
jgi:hypothetical protein